MRQRIVPSGTWFLLPALGLYGCSSVDDVPGGQDAFGAGGVAGAVGGSAAGGQATGGGANVGGSAAATGGSGGSTGGGVIAECIPSGGISVEDLYFSQAVHARLVQSGAWVAPEDREVPLITERETLFQATWALDDTYVPHPIEARLTLEQADGETVTLTETRTPNGAADLGELASAYSFVVSPELIRADTKFRIEFCEPSGATSTPGSGLASFPVGDEVHALEPWAERMQLKVMIVPASTTCASAPSWGDTERQAITDFIYNTYPVNDLDVRFHEPIHVENSCGEGDVMEQLTDLRLEEDLGPEWYYQAHFANGADTSTGGYAWVFEDDDEAIADRVGWVQYWADEVMMNVTHELGHNHGSDHTFSSDAFPPYVPAAGKEYGGRPQFGFALRGDHHPGVSGSMVHRILRPTISPEGVRIENGDSEDFFDAMSYDQPYWVSAFTYSEWGRRILASLGWGGASKQVGAALEVEWVQVVFSPEGGTSVRHMVRVPPRANAELELRGAGIVSRAPGQVVYACDGAIGMIGMPAEAYPMVWSGPIEVLVDGQKKLVIDP